MRGLPHPRARLGSTPLRAALLAGALTGLTAVVPQAASAAPAAPSPAPHHRHDAGPAAEPGKPAKPGKHRKHEGTGHRPGATPPPAVLGPTAPATARPPAARPHPLAGRTVGALSSAEAGPVLPFAVTPAEAGPARAPAPASAVQRSVRATWPPHDRVEWSGVSTSAHNVVAHPTAPLLVAALIVLFLLVQHQVDRHDPKLAGAHRNDPPDLRFGAPVRRGTSV